MTQVTVSSTPRPTSDPFASSASSPIPETITEDIKRWSSITDTYRPVEIIIDSNKGHSIPIIKPAPPPKAARSSYQSSHFDSRPVSQLPRIVDPEKATTAPRRSCYDNGYERFAKDYFYDDPAELKSRCLKVLVSFVFVDVLAVNNANDSHHSCTSPAQFFSLAWFWLSGLLFRSLSHYFFNQSTCFENPRPCENRPLILSRQLSSFTSASSYHLMVAKHTVHILWQCLS